MKHEIYYATGNSGKFEEASRCIKKHAPFIELKQLDIDIEEIQTLDQKAIALDKARKAYKIIGKPVLVDDGGIYFEKYHEFPGTLSKFIYKALGFEGIFRLVSEGDRGYFKLTLAYNDGKREKTFECKKEGEIVTLKKDTPFYHNLPFMSIFKPDGSDKTYAELHDSEEKEPYAFRQQAIKKFIEWYKLYHQKQELDDAHTTLSHDNLESL